MAVQPQGRRYPQKEERLQIREDAGKMSCFPDRQVKEEWITDTHSPNEMAEIGEKLADRSLTVTASYWSHAAGSEALPGATRYYFSPRLALSIMSTGCIHHVAVSLVETCLSSTLSTRRI